MDGQTDPTASRLAPGNREVEITLLKATGRGDDGHGGGRVRQVGEHLMAGCEVLLCCPNHVPNI